MQERRVNPDNLTSHERYNIMEKLFNELNDKIATNKMSQDEGLKKLQESIDRIESVLIPRDGSPSIPEQIRVLNKLRNSLTGVALTVAVAGLLWVGNTFMKIYNQTIGGK